MHVFEMPPPESNINRFFELKFNVNKSCLIYFGEPNKDGNYDGPKIYNIVLFFCAKRFCNCNFSQ